MTTEILSVISIDKARELGLKRYFTAKPCRHGHIAERFTSDRHCVQCKYIESQRRRKVNQHKTKEYMKQWFARNPGYVTRWFQENREAAKYFWNKSKSIRRGCAGRLSRGLSEKLFKLQRGKCACCRSSINNGFHLDHIEPLSKGGENEDLNIQLLCPSCNKSKHAKHPVDFMQERGFLL